AGSLAVFLVIVGGLIYYMNLQRTDEKKQLAALQQVINGQKDSLYKLMQAVLPPKSNNGQGGGNNAANASNGVAPSNLKDLYAHVYYIKTDRIVIEYNGQTQTAEFGLSGTGFLMSDGSFVTARHVVEPWFFLESSSPKAVLMTNIMASNGATITHYFTAYSPTGEKLEFKGAQFTVDR